MARQALRLFTNYSSGEPLTLSSVYVVLSAQFVFYKLLPVELLPSFQTLPTQTSHHKFLTYYEGCCPLNLQMCWVFILTSFVMLCFSLPVSKYCLIVLCKLYVQGHGPRLTRLCITYKNYVRDCHRRCAL